MFRTLPGLRPKHCGFTLMELLVVVAVIALLLAMLLPTLSKVRERGRTATCMANMRSIGHAMAAYAVDYHDYTPPRIIGSVGVLPPGPPNYPVWASAYWTDQLLLGQYVGNTNGDYLHPHYVYGTVMKRSPFVCPSDTFAGHPVGEEMPSSYSMGVNFAFIQLGQGWNKLWMMASCANPSTEMTVVDGFNVTFSPGGFSEPYTFYGRSDSNTNQSYSYSPDPNSLYNWSNRHNGGGANVLFLDGHVNFYPDLKPAYDRHEITLKQVF